MSRGWRLAASRFARIRGAPIGALKPIIRPSPPALGHLRNRKQSLDLIAITGVDAGYIPDREIMIGSVDYPDLIPGAYTSLGDDSQVRARPHRLGEAARKHRIVHPNSKPPARNPRFGNLENNLIGSVTYNDYSFFVPDLPTAL